MSEKRTAYLRVLTQVHVDAVLRKIRGQKADPAALAEATERLEEALVVRPDRKCQGCGKVVEGGPARRGRVPAFCSKVCYNRKFWKSYERPKAKPRKAKAKARARAKTAAA